MATIGIAVAVDAKAETWSCEGPEVAGLKGELAGYKQREGEAVTETEVDLGTRLDVDFCSLNVEVSDLVLCSGGESELPVITQSGIKVEVVGKYHVSRGKDSLSRLETD